MPKIIVQTNAVDGNPGEVTLAERLIPAAEHNEHYLSSLVERIGWALLDAEELEAGSERVGSDHDHARRQVIEARARRQVRRGAGSGRASLRV
jgi:hypothetical protein